MIHIQKRNSQIIKFKTMSHNDSPDNESVYNTRHEDLFPVFPYDNLPQNNPPQDLFPVFQYDNSPQNTPPEFLFPPAINPPANNPPHYNPPANFPAQNQTNARALTDEELYEQDMQELLRVEAEEERERRAREEYLRAKQARRNRRCAWRIQNGLPRVPSSDDDSSASSHEGYGSDDSFS